MAHDNIAEFARLVQHLGNASSSGVAGGAKATAPISLDACDPEPYNADLSKCQGFVMQCWFS